MASCSSSDHPESSHPYHGDRSHSTSTTELRGRKRTGILARLIPPSLRQGLLPLPEGARLSSSSPPPSLPKIPHTPLDLPHPASTPITETTEGDSTWAVTYESPPLPAMTILGMPILQHPQPRSAQASSGIMSPSPSAPTSLPHAMGRLSTEPLPQSQPPHSIEERPMSGIDQSRPGSRHSSLYRTRNPSPVDQPSQFQTTAATGQTSSSSARRGDDPDYTVDVGDISTDNSQQSHGLHRSYSRPLSRDTMSTSPVRQAERAPSRRSLDHPRPSQTRPPTPMEGQERPPSRRSVHEPLPEMDLTESIRFYQRTATDLSVAIPARLRRAEYRKLYEYYAYELPFILACLGRDPGWA